MANERLARSIFRLWLGTPGAGSFIGSGFRIAPGWLLTCRHVAAGREPREICIALDIGNRWPKRVLLHPDEQIDAALIEIEQDDSQPLCLPRSQHQPQADSELQLCGYGSETQDLEPRPLRLTHFEPQTRSWALHSQIARGMSGGPALFEGRVVGITFARDTDANRSYLLPLAAIADWLEQQLPAAKADFAPRHFVGRETELAELAAALIPSHGQPQPTAITALQGMPGVGKSCLVDRFAAVHRSAFPHYHRLALDARRATPTAEQLRAELAALIEANLPPEQLRATLLNQHALLHIENVDSDALAGPVAVLATQHLHGCAVVITGRWQGFGNADGWARLALRAFGRDDGLAQLADELGDLSDEQADRDNWPTLVDKLGGLPLALHAAAGLIRHGGYRVESLLGKLEKRGAKLLRIDAADDTAVRAAGDSSRLLLHEAFELLLEMFAQQVEQLGEDWLEQFYRLGHAPAAGVGASLAAAICALGEDDFDELAELARHCSLLDGQTAAGDGDTARYSLHPLLAEHLRRKQPDASEALDNIGAWFLARLPADVTGEDKTQRQRWAQIRAEQAALLDWLARMPPAQVETAAGAGFFFMLGNGPYLAWADFAQRALAQNPPDSSASRLLWLHIHACIKAGRAQQALASIEQKIALDGRNEDQRELALSQGAKADILQARGQLDEALRIYEADVFPVYEQLGDTRMLLVDRANFAMHLLKRDAEGDAARAAELLQLALTAAREMQIPEAGQIEECMAHFGIEPRD